MRAKPASLRRDSTPCLLYPVLLPRGGGLARAVVERANLYARHYEHVLILTTSFAYGIDEVVAELKERGSLDERVVVRNFFQHSNWVARLGEPPAAARSVFPRDEVESKRQRMPGGKFFRIADRHLDALHPHAYRYFDRHGRPLVTTRSSPGKRHELHATVHQPEPRETAWGAIVGQWVDEEIGPLKRPVLFSLQRGFSDPVLLAATKAARKVASLHNCHYRDPEDPSSGVRANFRALLSDPRAVDEIVCLTPQQRHELEDDAPGAVLRSIPYPGRPPRRPSAEKDLSLVVFVGQLIDRKRVDHAIRAFALVVRAIPPARLEIYGEGPAEAALRRLIDELGLQQSVALMGYSLTVSEAQARASCSLMTSTFEGFGRVVTESMSLGTPVIAYDIRYGPRDVIRHGVDGLLVDVHAPDALAVAIVSVLSQPQRASEMGARAREVIERFPVEAFERAWLDVVSARNPRRWPEWATPGRVAGVIRNPTRLVRALRRRLGSVSR